LSAEHTPRSFSTVKTVDMTFKLKNLGISVAATLTLAATLTTQNVSAEGLATYEVTVTNATNNVTFTPIIGVTHTSASSLFEVGEPASVALEELAEGGSPALLEANFDAIRNTVVEIATAAGSPADGPFTEAGQTATFRIRAHQGADRLSMAAMLLPTNDSFMALNAVHLPSRGSATYAAIGYDAGTELNDQLCSHIPGPQCDGTPDGEGTNPARNDRGDFVHVSSGVHDFGDLAAYKYDWRNPVAIVTVTRIGG